MAIQPRAAATRRKLIDAAAQLFADNGYLETTPRDIAQTAELTTGAFYYHFGSKEELAGAIIDQGWPSVEAILRSYLGKSGSGVESVIAAGFALTDLVNRNPAVWIAFHLDMAVGHLSPAARQACRKRLDAFSMLVPDALRDLEIRDGVTRKEAGELLWLALNGAQLLSDVAQESCSVRFGRMAMAWKSALRTIVPAEIFSAVAEFVDATAAQYVTGSPERSAVDERVA